MARAEELLHDSVGVAIDLVEVSVLDLDGTIRIYTVAGELFSPRRRELIHAFVRGRGRVRRR